MRNVLDMKEEIKGEIRNEINDFKQVMEREQQELIQFISDQCDSLKTSQQANEEKCVTLKNENICMKGTISNLLNKIDELEQYSRRNCLLYFIFILFYLKSSNQITMSYSTCKSCGC